MASSSTSSEKSEPASVKYMVLALGLLIGFVIGFVMLLASLPVDDTTTRFNAREAGDFQSTEAKYKFFEILPGKVVPPAPKRTYEEPPVEPVQPVVAVKKVIPPATRVVPANAQNLADGYTEVPANYKTSQSFYLQAGNFEQQNNAETMRAQVLLLGLEAFIVTREEADGSIRHRVRVGPYKDQSLLTEAKKRMRRGGVSYNVVRVTGS